MSNYKPRIYIAGPMRGVPKFNRPAFEDWAETLRAIGWDVVSPVEIGAKFGTDLQIDSDPELLRKVKGEELRALVTCEAIYLLRNWQYSVGAREELAAALSRHLAVYLAPHAPMPRTWKERK